jgi:Protein of unknown function (DUF2889)
VKPDASASCAAPRLEPADDPHAWHAMPSLPPGGTRRRRRLDVHAPGPDGLHPIDAHFRDSHVDGEGNETVVHEYAVTGSVDARTTFDDLRLRVRRELVGTASCTHLNDTLRSLADVGALLPFRPRRVTRAAPGPPSADQSGTREPP